jgi:hypothetical protein
MKLEKKDLRQIAENFLAVLDKKKVHSFDNARALRFEEILIGNLPNDRVAFDIGIGPRGTECLTITYVRKGTGSPIEARLNDSMNYTMMIVKCAENIEGYGPFAIDKFENIAQARHYDGIDFLEVRKELEKLSRLE